MSEQVIDEVEDLEQPAADGEIVHWMDRRPIAVGPAGVCAAALGGFVLGVAATLSALAFAGWLGPEREVELRRFRRL